MLVSAASVACGCGTTWNLPETAESVGIQGRAGKPDRRLILERACEHKVAHCEIGTEHPGYLGTQDTYYVGRLHRTRSPARRRSEARLSVAEATAQRACELWDMASSDPSQLGP